VVAGPTLKFAPLARRVHRLFAFSRRALRPFDSLAQLLPFT
jgi:hypothetical protein